MSWYIIPVYKTVLAPLGMFRPLAHLVALLAEMGSTECLMRKLSAKIPMVSPVGNGMAVLSLKFKNFFINVIS
jgi:hypothetical protein